MQWEGVRNRPVWREWGRRRKNSSSSRRGLYETLYRGRGGERDMECRLQRVQYQPRANHIPRPPLMDWPR